MAHDLDDEELKATKKLNGTDRRGVEEDIKILEELIEWTKEEGIEECGMEKELPALEHLIKAYKELEEENSIQKSQLMSAFDRGFIHKSLVEEKIEELKEKKQNISEGSLDYQLRQYNYIGCKIDVLQELLEKRK